MDLDRCRGTKEECLRLLAGLPSRACEPEALGSGPPSQGAAKDHAGVIWEEISMLGNYVSSLPFIDVETWWLTSKNWGFCQRGVLCVGGHAIEPSPLIGRRTFVGLQPQRRT
jgi:hypothetical protein